MQHLDDDDYFVIDNFFSYKSLDEAMEEISNVPSMDFIDKYGVWQGKKIATIHYMDDAWKKLPAVTSLLNQITPRFKRKDLEWMRVNFQVMYLPWDIHSDWEQTNDRESYYNVIIPFEDATASTILFNQKSDGSRAFVDYKKNHSEIEDPVSEEIWNQHLNMCWPQDRKYLSIREILPEQRRGQLIGFRSNIIHSSDNFHQKMDQPKKIIQALMSIPK